MTPTRHTLGPFLVILTLGFPGSSFANQIIISPKDRKIIVQLDNKGPHLIREEIDWKTWEDTPIYSPYLKALKMQGFRPSTMLKWQNAISGYAAEKRLPSLQQLKFVRNLVLAPRKKKCLFTPGSRSLLLKSALLNPYQMVKIDAAIAWLHSWGLQPGEGMRIAVIDNGFNLYHRAFQRLKEENRIKDQWDYVQNRQLAVTSQEGLHSHGAQILAVIAGHLTGSYTGIAPFADFLLYRAENDTSETYVEEDYAAAAIMRAVERGAHIINISLGYRYDFNETQTSHPYSYFDGKTRPASFAALSAARRNVIVAASMGNEDLNHPGEPSLSSPADADSILAVGAMQNATERWPLSSRGPTFDGRIKPDISAPGSQVPVPNPATQTELTTESGTSLATPIIAAIAALAWQSHPTTCAQAIRTAIMESGHLADTPNNEVGHGLVDAEQVLFSVAAMSGQICTGLEIKGNTTKPRLPQRLWLPDPWRRVFNLKGQATRMDASMPVINISTKEIPQKGDR